MTDSHEIHRLDTVYTIPEFVKSSGVLEESDPEVDLPSQAFADPINRKFPTHTKEATWLSNARFWEAAIVDSNANPNTGKELIKAAQYWGIESDVRELLEKVASMPRVREAGDLSDDHFCLVVEQPDNPSQKIRMYPVTHRDQVKLAAERLYQERTVLPLAWRREAAKNLLSKAAMFQAPIGNEKVAEFVERASGQGITSAETLAEIMRNRAGMLSVRKHPKEASAMSKAADCVATQKSTMGLSTKVAELLDEVDRRTGLYQSYQSGLPVPEEQCHAVLLKHARAAVADFIRFPTGNYYKASEVAKAKMSAYPGNSRDVLSFDGSLDMAKFASVAPKLSVADARLLEKSLEAEGIMPHRLPVELPVL